MSRSLDRKLADRVYNAKAWKVVRAFVLERDGGVCAVEGCEAPAEAVDHIIPWREGGPWYDPENLRAICKFHNSSRVRRPNDYAMSGAGRRPSREW